MWGQYTSTYVLMMSKPLINVQVNAKLWKRLENRSKPQEPCVYKNTNNMRRLMIHLCWLMEQDSALNYPRESSRWPNGRLNTGRMINLVCVDACPGMVDAWQHQIYFHQLRERSCRPLGSTNTGSKNILSDACPCSARRMVLEICLPPASRELTPTELSVAVDRYLFLTNFLLQLKVNTYILSYVIF